MRKEKISVKKIKNLLKVSVLFLTMLVISTACGNTQDDVKVEVTESTVSENHDASEAIDELVVNISLDNVKDYFDIETVDEVDPFGKTTGTKYAYLKSKMYDEGWVIKEFSDFAIKTKVIEASQDAIYFTGDEFTLQVDRCKNDVIENFLDAKGTVTYVPIESVKNYSYDEKEEVRKIELQNGEIYEIHQYAFYPYKF